MPAETSDEMRGLKTCLNDLMGILTLPAIWSGREQEHIVSTLLDAVSRVLELDFVYAHLNVPDGKRIEMIRIADPENTGIDNDGLRKMLRLWLRNEPGARPSVLRGPDEDSQFGLAAFGLGADERMGVFVAGSTRYGFPGKSERLLLNVAANEAAVGLREAQLLNEQRKVAQELDLETTQQREELAIAYDQLDRENAHRKAVEEALRSVEERFSLAAQVAAAAEDARKSAVAELREKYALLTPREREVLPFVVAGRLSKQTAAELGTSEITIRVHRRQIMRKMRAHSLAELIRMADNLGIH